MHSAKWERFTAFKSVFCYCLIFLSVSNKIVPICYISHYPGISSDIKDWKTSKEAKIAAQRRTELEHLLKIERDKTRFS